MREDVIESDHLRRARRVLSLLATHQEIADLVSVGAYVAGVNREHDLAVRFSGRINEFLQQECGECFSFRESIDALAALTDEIDEAVAG